MKTKTVSFEMPTGEEIEIDIEYSYSFDPGRYSGRIDKCYPMEEEVELVLPDDLTARLTAYFVDNVLPSWVAAVNRQASYFESGGIVAEWASEEAAAQEDARADAYNDRMREERGL